VENAFHFRHVAWHRPWPNGTVANQAKCRHFGFAVDSLFHFRYIGCRLACPVWPVAGMSIRRGATLLLAALTMALGVALVVATLAQGGGFLGIMLGLLFLAAGAGRFYLTRRSTR
jgi:hypothetical protein